MKARSDQDQRPKRGRDDRQAALFSLHAEDLAALRGHLLANSVAVDGILDGSPGPAREMWPRRPGRLGA